MLCCAGVLSAAAMCHNPNVPPRAGGCRRCCCCTRRWLARRKEMWAAANAEGSTVLIVPTMPTNAQ